MKKWILLFNIVFSMVSFLSAQCGDLECGDGFYPGDFGGGDCTCSDISGAIVGDDGSCYCPAGYTLFAVFDCGECINIQIPGCNDPEAVNYEPNLSGCDDGTNNCCQYQDSYGNICPPSIMDSCGVCDGGNADMDCSGICFGQRIFDECGVCDDDPFNDCVQDCAGEWGGIAVEDECGICGGDGASCNNSHTYISVPTDFALIKDAILSAEPGDTIIVDDGTYNENLTINKPIVLASQFLIDGDPNHIQNTIIDGGSPSDPNKASVILFHTNDSTYVGSSPEVHGFTLKNGYGTMVYKQNEDGTIGSGVVGGGLLILNMCPIINNNHIRNNGESTQRGTRAARGGGGVVGDDIGIDEFRDEERNPTLDCGELDFSTNIFTANKADVGKSFHASGSSHSINLSNGNFDVFSNGQGASNYWFSRGPSVGNTISYDFSGGTGDSPALDGEIFINGETGNDDTGNGSETNPFKTVSHALSLVYGGEGNEVSIIIADGTYSEAMGEDFPLTFVDFVNLFGSANVDFDDLDDIFDWEDMEESGMFGFEFGDDDFDDWEDDFDDMEFGCTNSLAQNYDEDAEFNDGSCYFGTDYEQPFCGDGYCDYNELVYNCPTDCNNGNNQNSYCGDGDCNPGEQVYCEEDCIGNSGYGAQNQQVVSFEDETALICVQINENASACGNGVCEESWGETLDSCPEDCYQSMCQFYDCIGQCADGYNDWVGDGYCDDGTWGLYFNCDEFGNDAGDCDEVINCVDCIGQDCTGYEAWIGDGFCDDGTWGLYFNCDEFDNDAGDCDIVTYQNSDAKDIYIPNQQHSEKEPYVNNSSRDGGLQYILVEGPEHGNLSGFDGSCVTYTPFQNYHGPDSFEYRVTDDNDENDSDDDGSNWTNLATVIIINQAVNDAPEVISEIQNYEVVVGGEPIMVDFNDVFFDVDDGLDSLSYSISTANNLFSINEGATFFYMNNFISSGFETVFVSAYDDSGSSVSTSFTVTVIETTNNYTFVPDDVTTISEAIFRAEAGDSIIVRDGLYYENLVIDKPISILSEYFIDSNPEHILNTIIDGRNAEKSVALFYTGDPQFIGSTPELSGFTLQYGIGTTVFYPEIDTTYIAGGGFLVLNMCPIISHNKITNNGYSLDNRGTRTTRGGGGVVGDDIGIDEFRNDPIPLVCESINITNNRFNGNDALLGKDLHITGFSRNLDLNNSHFEVFNQDIENFSNYWVSSTMRIGESLELQCVNCFGDELYRMGDIFVSLQGGESGNGLNEMPFNSISKALRVAYGNNTQNATIHIDLGEYNAQTGEIFPLPIVNWVTLISPDGGVTINSGDEETFVWDDVWGSNMFGLDIVGPSSQQLVGCNDPEASNFNPLTIANDGSCLYGILLGDVHENGIINVSDIILLVSIILEEVSPTSYMTFSGDVNSDGNLNISDIIAIVDIILAREVNDFSSISNVEIQKGKSSLNLHADGDVAGIQIEYDGEISVINSTLNEHWIILHNNHTILIYNINGEAISNSQLLNFEGVFEIIEVLAVDWDMNSIIANIEELPINTQLLSSYPNPFNPSVNIHFTLSEEALVSVDIYNITGQKIVELFNGIKTEGYHQTSWDASGFASGMYIVKFISNSNITSQKILLMK